MKGLTAVLNHATDAAIFLHHISTDSTEPVATFFSTGTESLPGLPMETVIYYFTGTGNSLAVASTLSERLGKCRCEPIVSLRKRDGKVQTESERVGIVFPVYYLGVPVVVAEVAGRLDIKDARYTFAVCTLGGSGGSTSLHELDQVLRNGVGGRGLDAGFPVRMPGNNILLYDRSGEGTLKRTFEGAARRIEAIVTAVDNEQRTMPLHTPLHSLLHRAFHPRFVEKVHDADRDFSVDDSCTACGTCAAVCPVGNIRLEDGRPTWLHRCEQCLACIQLCPAEAIQVGTKTGGRRRYRHPDVPVEAIAGQSKG